LLLVESGYRRQPTRSIKECSMFRIAMLRLWVAASIVFLVALTATPAAARTWTDQRGRTISGKFVRVDGDKVVILSGGKVVTPRLASLSQADQNYVRDVLAGKQSADDSPGQADSESPGKAGGGLDLQTEENGDSEGESSSSDPFHSSATQKDSDNDASDDSSQGEGEDDSDDDASNNASPGAKRSSSGLPVKTTASLRNWSTAKGPVRGTFVRYYDGNVIIKRGAKVEQHSFWTLGDGDQQYVRDLLAARGTPDAIPDSPPASLATEGASSQGGAPIGAAGMPGIAGAGRGVPMGMAGPPGMRGPGAMGAMPGSMPGAMPGAMPGMGQVPGRGGAIGGPIGTSPPGANTIAGMPGGMLGGMPGTPNGAIGGIPGGIPGAMPGMPNGAIGGMPGGMPSAGIGPRFGPSGLDPSGLGPTGIGPRMGTGLGSGMGHQPGGPTFARNETPLPTLAPPPDITMPKQFVTPARPFGEPFANQEKPPPEAVAVGVMIIVLSIACPAILFIAFVGFLIWLIVKMTSRPSYGQTY
jgi:hypothetical protein